MRILFTQETDWLLRGPHQQHHLAEMMSLRGHDIRVIDYEFLWRSNEKRGIRSKRKVYENVSKIYPGGSVTVIRPGIIMAPMFDYASLFVSHSGEIKRQVSEFKPDVIVGWGILNSYLASGIARRNGIPFIYYWIDVIHKLIPSRAYHPLGRLVERMTLKRADVVTVINHKLKDYVTGNGTPAEKTRVLGAGIDIKRFNPSNYDKERQSIRAQHGIKKEDTVLFFMGWIYHFAGLKEVCKELARPNGKGVKLLIVGEGDAYTELERIRDENGTKERVILTGKRPYDEIPSLIAASDICLLPAYPDEEIMQDIVPIKLYEYMAMKKPVISTRLPGVVKEFGENNGMVYVDRPEDVIAKATELVQCGKVEGLGQKARKYVERNSWDKITDEFEEILEEVIKEKRVECTPLELN